MCTLFAGDESSLSATNDVGFSTAGALGPEPVRGSPASLEAAAHSTGNNHQPPGSRPPNTAGGVDLLEPLRRLTYRVNEVVAITGMSERHVRALISAGVIPSVRLAGGCVLIPVDRLTQLLRGDQVDGDE